MRLADKLDKLIEDKSLKPILAPYTLYEAINNISEPNQDDDGIINLQLNDVDLHEMVLPAVVGKFIIDDIQKRPNGTYEVHLQKVKQ